MGIMLLRGAKLLLLPLLITDAVYLSCEFNLGYSKCYVQILVSSSFFQLRKSFC